MRRAYKFLLRPTSRQVCMLEQCLEDTRQLYNAALEERREAWRMGKHKITYYSQDAQLKDIRRADPERYGRWAYTCERSAIRRLDAAFKAFYKRCRTPGKKPGYPRFKGPGRLDSIEWEYKGGAIWDSVPHPTVTRVRLQGIGHVRVHQHRPVKGTIKTVTVKRAAGRWYVILSCDDVPAEPLEPTGSAIGIDMGVASFLTTSDGEHVPNPRHGKVAADALAEAQRAVSRFPRRKAAGRSRKHRQAAAKVARIRRKTTRQRLDHAHKTALALVRDHDLIVHEDLRIKNMARRPKPRPVGDGTYELNGSAAKAGLSKSIYDAGWGVLLKILRAKAEWAGRVVIEVDARHTSRRCSRCGHAAKGNRVKQAVFRCVKCGHEAHADVNAAINILRAGLVLREAQATREAA